jgi:hypothetical protein
VACTTCYIKTQLYDTWTPSRTKRRSQWQYWILAALSRWCSWCAAWNMYYPYVSCFVARWALVTNTSCVPKCFTGPCIVVLFGTSSGCALLNPCCGETWNFNYDPWWNCKGTGCSFLSCIFGSAVPFYSFTSLKSPCPFALDYVSTLFSFQIRSWIQIPIFESL